MKIAVADSPKMGESSLRKYAASRGGPETMRD
jgi:hypothetical protein